MKGECWEGEGRRAIGRERWGRKGECWEGEGGEAERGGV